MNRTVLILMAAVAVNGCAEATTVESGIPPPVPTPALQCAQQVSEGHFDRFPGFEGYPTSFEAVDGFIEGLSGAGEKIVELGDYQVRYLGWEVDQDGIGSAQVFLVVAEDGRQAMRLRVTSRRTGQGRPSLCCLRIWPANHAPAR